MAEGHQGEEGEPWQCWVKGGLRKELACKGAMLRKGTSTRCEFWTGRAKGIAEMKERRLIQLLRHQGNLPVRQKVKKQSFIYDEKSTEIDATSVRKKTMFQNYRCKRE